jgi:rhodanese-related sulfurtransferase
MTHPSPGPVPAPQPLDANGLPLGYPFRPQDEVTPRQTRAVLASDRPALLLDCRRPEEWQFNRIAGATHVPMNEIERRLDELEGEDGQRDQPIIVYCHHGRRSMNVTLQLRAHGFTNVRSMAGGIDLWSVDIDPSVPRY